MAGIVLPQLAPASEDRVSGAQVIDGSLKFDKSKSQYLKFTPTTTGNRRTWTFSCWFRKMEDSANRVIFSSYGSSPWTAIQTTGNNDGRIQATFDAGVSSGYYTAARYRDNGWYHLVWAVDTTQSTDPDKSKLYINGVLQTYESNAHPSLNEETPFNLASRTMYIGYTPNQSFDGHMSQCYFLDGLSIGPEFFGYTDSLTNTWRPRVKLKKTVNDGTNFTADITNTGSTLNNPGRIFDGTIDSDATIASGAATITYTPSTPIKYTDSVRVMGSGSPSNPYNARWQLNGGSDVSTVNANEFVTLDEGNGGGTITSIKLTVDSGGANWRAIEVDGIIMKANAAEPVNFGTNGFHLPMDGNSPIGQDQSGNGNDWTPVNFGGSTEISKATGAFPVLNTGQGGSVGRPGVFGSDVGFHETVNSSSGSPNPYIFDDRGTQPVLNFIRGATYIFDYSSATGHPLRFATAADAAGSTEYTDGTSVSGNVISFTVPHDAPDTLYYYCTNHGLMGNSINVTTDITKADPYAWKCVLAMPLVGGSGSDLSSQINATTSAKAVTVTSASDSSLCNFYGSSMNFDGSDDKLDVADSTDFAVDTGDWCAECWFYTPASDSTSKTVFQNNSGSDAQINLGINSLQLFAYLGSTQVIFAGADTAVQAKTWHHIALNHDDSLGANGTTTLYIDGQARATATTAVPTGNHNGFFLGHNTAHSTRWISANYQDVRFYKGTKKYTGNFIPASTNPDILPDTPSGVATKTQLTKITDGAVSFDGTGDELNVAGHSDLTLGTGNFTIECFAYFNSFDDTYPTVLSKLVDSTLSWIVRVKNDGKLVWYSKNGGGTNNESSTTPIGLKRWHHIVVVREGTGSNQLKGYVDGKEVLTMTDANDYNDTNALCIGTQQAGGGNTINGLISNVRIINGTALYTSNFTPPTQPLTAVTNTKLLCCQSNTSATAAAVIPTGSITANGDAAATNFNPFNTDINTVRGQETGYATLNPLKSTVSLSEGNLKQAQTSGTWNVAVSSIPMSTGKWYCEVTLLDGNTFQMGIIKLDDGPDWVANFPLVDFPYGWGMIVDGSTAKLRSDYITQLNERTDIEYNSTAPVTGDTIGMAYDADTQALTFYVNGKSYGDTTSYWNYPPTPGEYVFGNSVVSNTDALWNFGQKPFKFPPPDGYQPLTSSAARPDTIVPPDQYVSATLYTGDNNSSQDIDVGFAPDLVWQKIRSQAGDHALTDTVRGISGGYLQSEDPDAQKGNANDGISAFLPNGFRAFNSFNNNGLNWVSWCWKAGGSSGTFNVDDVGYANASDVNMNIGAQNGSTFLKGQVWSGLMSASGGFDQAASRAFDGFLQTDPNRLRTSGNQVLVTMTLSTPVTVSSQIKVHAEPGYNSSCTVTVGGVTYTSSTGALHTFNVSGSLTQMTLQSTQSGGRTYMEGMEIDGKLLVDDNITVNAPSVDNTGCSVGTKQGFSIIAYNPTGSNLRVSHGLSERPGFIILKSKNVSGDWLVWHQSLSSDTHFMKLNATNPESQASNVFLSVDSNTFGTGNDSGINSGTQQKIAYIWHDVSGLQKFGRYSGNGSSSGPFLECGFRPAIILLKKINNTDANSGWHWYDNKRNTYNPANNFLLAGHNYYENRAANNTADISSYTVDFLANGFRLSHSSNNLNTSGSDYIYCAWAEAPAFNLYGAQSNAR